MSFFLFCYCFYAVPVIDFVVAGLVVVLFQVVVVNDLINVFVVAKAILFTPIHL